MRQPRGVASDAPSPLLTVLIPVHNRLTCLVETLTRLRECLTPQVEVVVVDDASADGTAAAVADLFPECRVLRLPQRGGPAVARNAGLQIARGRYYRSLPSNAMACFIPRSSPEGSRYCWSTSAVTTISTTLTA